MLMCFPEDNRTSCSDPPFGPLCHVLFAIVLALALTSCDGGGGNDGGGGDGDPDPGLAPPSVAGSIEDRTLEADDDPVEIEISDLFNGEELEVSASSSDSEVASASTSGTAVTVDPKNGGTATVTVLAKNEAGTASEEFDVQVNLPSSPGPPGD